MSILIFWGCKYIFNCFIFCEGTYRGSTWSDRRSINVGFERFSKSSLYLNMKMFMPSLGIEFRKNSEDKIKLKILMLSSLKYSSQKLK